MLTMGLFKLATEYYSLLKIPHVWLALNSTPVSMKSVKVNMNGKPVSLFTVSSQYLQ